MVPHTDSTHITLQDFPKFTDEWGVLTKIYGNKKAGKHQLS